MSIDRANALEHLQHVLDAFSEIDRECSGNETQQVTYMTIRLRAAIDRLAPLGSPYRRVLESDPMHSWAEMQELAGAVRALREDYRGDFLQTYRELFNAELFSDFLGMAEYLLQNEKLKQPAAVLAGGVLEEHLRKLCQKHGIDTTTISNGNVQPKRADAMNQELRRIAVYNLIEQQQVTAWCAIRNNAAHGHFDAFDEGQVSVMILGIRGFVCRYSA